MRFYIQEFIYKANKKVTFPCKLIKSVGSMSPIYMDVF